LVTFSDRNSVSNISRFNSASDAFTDNHTGSEREEIDSQWLFTTTQEWATGQAQMGYQRRRSRHIRERDQRRRLREIEGFGLELDNYILVDTWTNLEQYPEQGQSSDQSQTGQEGQEGQEIEPMDQGQQERRYVGAQAIIGGLIVDARHIYQSMIC
jgi:hypothetical protein